MSSGSDLFEFSEDLGRVVRKGSWDDQSVGTYSKLIGSIRSWSTTDAQDYARFFVQEAKVIYQLHSRLFPDIIEFLTDEGISDHQIAAIEESIAPLIALPDGKTFDRESMMVEVDRLCTELLSLVQAGEWLSAENKAADLKETWRQLKDRDGDHVYGLIVAVVINLGEDKLGAMWDCIIRPLFDWRYSKFDVDVQPWEESLSQLLMVACESMRGHLVGVDRTGDFELREYDDRFVLRFDPCGSGGRFVRGDTIEGTPSRMEPPYNWTVSAEPHTWNHGKIGICHYCTHCIRLMEEMPIDLFGYPVRVVDPPVYPDNDPDNRQYCQWQMFKRPEGVPAEYYERVGRSKPKVLGSGTGRKEQNTATRGFLGNG